MPATRETIEIRQHDADWLIAKHAFVPILTPERIKPAPMHHVITNVTDGPCLIGNTNIKLTDPCMIAGEIGSDKPTQGKDKSKRQPQTCKRCIQFQGLNSSSCQGRSGKGGRDSCEYFTEDGTARWVSSNEEYSSNRNNKNETIDFDYSSTPSILDTKLQTCKDLPFHFKNSNIPAQGQPQCHYITAQLSLV